MKKKVFWCLLSLSIVLTTLFMPQNAKAAMSNNSEVQDSQKAELSKLTAQVQHINKSQFKGVTMYKGSMVLILKNKASEDLAGFESTQKSLLNNTQKALMKLKGSPLAKQGILVTGGYIKTDDGTWLPTASFWYSDPNYIDFDTSVNGYDEYLDTLDKADNYYIFGQWLTVTNGKGIFEDSDLISLDGAPEWFTPVFSGDVHFKPIKALTDKDYLKILKNSNNYKNQVISFKGKVTKKHQDMLWIKSLKHSENKYAMVKVKTSKKVKKGTKVKVNGTFSGLGADYLLISNAAVKPLKK